MTTGCYHRHHTTSRGSERYGFELTQGEYAALSAQIAFHELTKDEMLVKLCIAGGGRERWAAWFKGEWLPLVFDPAAARIVTLLPKNELRKYRKQLPW